MTRIEINHEGIGKLLKSPGVLADVKRRAEAIAEACGDGYEADAEVQGHRAHAAAYTATIEGRIDNAYHNSLIKNLDAGRG